ncbi:MAG: queuosine precursor transporter [Dehalococcoidia bacterium]
MTAAPRTATRPQLVSIQFVIVTALFVTALIAANVMSVKLVNLAGVEIDAGTIIFPLTYIFGDVLTEVYGYGRARQVIWLGFFCNLLFVLAMWAGQIAPASANFDAQPAYERILGYTPRLLLASFSAYLVGEFVNSYILARLKVATHGRFLWLRTISSTMAAQAVDSIIFITIAFAGEVSWAVVWVIARNNWVLKTTYEVLATPLTYLIVTRLKDIEGVDVYDRGTNWNPFAWLPFVGRTRQPG